MNVKDMADAVRENIDCVYYDNGFNVTPEYITFAAFNMFKHDANMTQRVSRYISWHLIRKYPMREGHKVLTPTKDNLFAILNGELDRACV